MSKNVVDATIRLAYRQRLPVMVIASRRQVDDAAFDGGYVERWTTEQFVAYIRRRDPRGRVIVCRDHGGPWQHPREIEAGMSEREAMASGLASLRCDVRCGVQLLHLDTSQEAGGAADFTVAVARLVRLYGDCNELASSLGRKVGFEVGLERQTDVVDDPVDFGFKLDLILERLREASLPPPRFVVAQTGTHVAGVGNRGAIVAEPLPVLRAVRGLAKRCWEHGLGLKAHNVDYLPSPAVRGLIRSGVDAVNIAPELGVVESRTFISLATRLGMLRERDAFLRLAYDSGAWRKWFQADGADDELRSIAAGHYVFGTDEFRELKRRVDRACRQRDGTTVDQLVSVALDRTLGRYAGAVG